MSATQEKFWEKPLQALTELEWEALCDGCGRCCLKKLTDSESEQIQFTRVVCRYFDERSSRCKCYGERTQLVPDCFNVKQMDIGTVNWMPDTCAYRLRFDGKPLFDWHPLVAGSRDKMQAAGISIGKRVISEEYVHPDGYEEHIIRWVKA
ncbi:MAG: YcgN family cysteine cluster protein [Gammaproteobacteria bacterium]|nr:YcgN family cysteine cluster protein [Gammaproteobacteria bacterium]